MSSLSPEQLQKLKHRTAEQLSRVTAQIKEIQRHLSRDIRHQGFGLLRKGVAAVTNSFKAWAERQVT